MTVLLLAVFLLVVMPALLFWLGRLASAATDGRRVRRDKAGRMQRDEPDRVQQDDPDRVPWYQRPMQPAFGKPDAEP